MIFSHVTFKGMVLHLFTQETENDHLLDVGALVPERKTCYRQPFARFSHRPAIAWNLGEENVQSAQQRMDCAAFFCAIELDLQPAGFNHVFNYWCVTAGESGVDELVVAPTGITGG